MVKVVTSQDRVRFAASLESMYRDRKRVFIDELGWELPAKGELEVDQFDTDDTVYLLVLDANGEHLGSLRLLPTARPHLLSEIFPHLCEEGPPLGPRIWEISRLCTRPGLADPRKVRQQLVLGLTEFALIQGITHYTCVTHVPYLSRLLAIGWECEPLGLPVRFGGLEIGALRIAMSPDTLFLLRRRSGVHAPVLEIALPEVA